MNLIAAFLSKLAIGILNTLLSRKDLKDSVRKDIELASERFAKNAYQWKEEHPVNLDDLPPGLKLRKPGSKKRLSD